MKVIKIYMAIIVNARIKNGIIYPTEKIDIEDKEVVVKIEDKTEHESAFSIKFDIPEKIALEIIEDEDIW